MNNQGVPMLRFLLWTTLSFLPTMLEAACLVQSGPSTRALVELYTSEGCSSCPPADKRLAQLPTNIPDAAIPIALHVGYWDYIGWKDPYARSEFGQRQKTLARINRTQVYTPQFFISGRALSAWRDSASGLDAAIRSVQNQAARAEIQLTIDNSRSDILSVTARANSPLTATPLALYLALTEKGLSNKIDAGENQGAVLRHDHVVREWWGPLTLKNGVLHIQQAVALQPNWRRNQLTVVGFVQNSVTGEVLQALSSAACTL